MRRLTGTRPTALRAEMMRMTCPSWRSQWHTTCNLAPALKPQEASSVRRMLFIKELNGVSDLLMPYGLSEPQRQGQSSEASVPMPHWQPIADRAQPVPSQPHPKQRRSPHPSDRLPPPLPGHSPEPIGPQASATLTPAASTRPQTVPSHPQPFSPRAQSPTASPAPQKGVRANLQALRPTHFATSAEPKALRARLQHLAHAPRWGTRKAKPPARNALSLARNPNNFARNPKSLVP